MAKRTSKRKQRAAGGQQDLKAQLKAVDRLIEQEKYDQAQSRLRRMLKAHRKHSGLWSRLYDVLDLSGKRVKAALVSYDWAQATPQNINAWAALSDDCMELNLPGLADHAARQYVDLGGDVPPDAVPPFPADFWREGEPTPFGPAPSYEETVRIDLGRLFLLAEKFRRCAKLMAGESWLAARNNHGLALFHQGELEQSAQVFEQAWLQQPRNLLALAWLLKIQLMLGSVNGSLLQSLREGEAFRMEDAQAQMEGLLLLDKPVWAWERFQAYREQEWFDLDYLNTRLIVAAAAGKAGQEQWVEGVLTVPANESQPDMLQALQDFSLAPGKRKGIGVLTMLNCVPKTWTTQWQKSGSVTNGEQFDALMSEYAGSFNEDYLHAIYRFGDESIRVFVRLMLRLRIKTGDDKAMEIAIAITQEPQGSNDERLNLLYSLVDLGVLKVHEPCDYWDGTGLTQISLSQQTIVDEPVPSSLSPDAQNDLANAVEALKVDDLPRARRLLEDLYERYPEDSSVLGNLAVLYEKQGDWVKADELLTHAVTVNPDYIIGRCNLAQKRMLEGEMAEAERLLQGLLEERNRLHPQEAFMLFLNYARLAMYTGEYERAENLLENLTDMEEHWLSSSQSEVVDQLREALNRLMALEH